jgi:hypothetical protein
LPDRERRGERPSNAGITTSGRVLDRRSLPPRTEHAELVALGIGEDDPGFLALADVSMCGAEFEKTSHLAPLIVGAKVEMESVLDRLALRHSNEQQTRESVRLRSNLEVVWIVVDDHPAQG